MSLPVVAEEFHQFGDDLGLYDVSDRKRGFLYDVIDGGIPIWCHYLSFVAEEFHQFGDDPGLYDVIDGGDSYMMSLPVVVAEEFHQFGDDPGLYDVIDGGIPLLGQEFSGRPVYTAYAAGRPYRSLPRWSLPESAPDPARSSSHCNIL